MSNSSEKTPLPGHYGELTDFFYKLKEIIGNRDHKFYKEKTSEDLGTLVMNIPLVGRHLTTRLVQKYVRDLIIKLSTKYEYIVEYLRKLDGQSRKIQDLTVEKNELAELNKYIDKFQKYPIICLPETMTINEHEITTEYIKNLYEFKKGEDTGHASTPDQRSQNHDYYKLKQDMPQRIDKNKRDEYTEKILKIFAGETDETADKEAPTEPKTGGKNKSKKRHNNSKHKTRKHRRHKKFHRRHKKSKKHKRHKRHKKSNKRH